MRTPRQIDHGMPFTVCLAIGEVAHREVLTRLAKLNHERYAEQVWQGLHEKKGKKGSTKQRSSRRKKTDDQQMPLF